LVGAATGHEPPVHENAGVTMHCSTPVHVGIAPHVLPHDWRPNCVTHPPSHATKSGRHDATEQLPAAHVKTALAAAALHGSHDAAAQPYSGASVGTHCLFGHGFCPVGQGPALAPSSDPDSAPPSPGAAGAPSAQAHWLARHARPGPQCTLQAPQ
jgi:hypothetical protein